MKYALFFALIFFSLTSSAQEKQKPAPVKNPQPDTTKPVKQPIKPPAYRDYNFAFVTDGNFSQVTNNYKLDTATQRIQARADTVEKKSLQVVVRKEAGVLRVSDVNPVSSNPDFYNAPVKFLGSTTDGSNALAYQALTETKETILINPGLGVMVISFKACDKNQICDTRNFYFGAVDLKILR